MIIPVGDIHGEILTLLNKIVDITDSHFIVAGDCGIGIMYAEKKKLRQSNYRLKKSNNHLYFVRGNHDNPNMFEDSPYNFSNIHLVKDYTVLELEGRRILCVGGAISVDRTANYLGIDYWENEGFVFDSDKAHEFRNITDVITHNAPDYCFPLGYNAPIIKEYYDSGDIWIYRDVAEERENIRKFIDILLMNNKIENIFYGHYHQSNTTFMMGVKFVLLGIGEFGRIT